MISCGIQCLACDYPIHFDTYLGCSHACKYCFVNHQHSIKQIKPVDMAKGIRKFIQGKRTNDTKWCDWNIPLHWGAMSDPFQECESEYKSSLECLKVFAETKYPFIVSTKNPVLAVTESYLSLLSSCDVVFQISMACSKYDKLEIGAPTYEERLKAASTLSKHVQRLIVRVQPFFPDCFKDILAEIPRYAESGAYGVIVEGYVSTKKQKGMQRDGKKYDFSLDILVPMYKKIREECHKHGLRFFCGEDRVRFLGDSLSCCGTENLETFKPNTYNIEHLAHDTAEPTERMKEHGGVYCFKSRNQCVAWWNEIKGKTFEELMHYIGDDYIYWYRELRDKYKDD